LTILLLASAFFLRIAPHQLGLRLQQVLSLVDGLLGTLDQLLPAGANLAKRRAAFPPPFAPRMLEPVEDFEQINEFIEECAQFIHGK